MAKIVIVAGTTDSLIRFRGELLKELINLGHSVYATAGNGDTANEETLASMGVKFHQLRIPRTGTNVFNDVKYFWNLLVFFNKIKPDLIFCYTIKPVIYGMLAGYLARIPKRYALITGLGYAFIPKKKISWRLINITAKSLYKTGLFFAQGVFFQNSDDSSFFKSQNLVSKKTPTFIVNGSGVNTDYYQQEPLPSTAVFILIARLLKDKGIFEYISAVKSLIANNISAKFYLVGPYDSNPAGICQQQVQSWVNDGLIDYVGPVSDVREWIKNASIFVLPSYREGTPRSVLEAMAMGRPIITTDAPGCKETVIEQFNGFLVPTEDSVALAHAMTTLALNGELRSKMGHNSRQLALDKYKVEKVNSFLLEKMDLV